VSNTFFPRRFFIFGRGWTRAGRLAAAPPPVSYPGVRSPPPRPRLAHVQRTKRCRDNISGRRPYASILYRRCWCRWYSLRRS
jgi:hypothetical protein